MSLVQIKLDAEDYQLLKKWAEKRKISIIGAFREITGSSFENWKLNYLIDEYAGGSLRLKDLWTKSKLTLPALFRLLEERSIDPQKPEILELMSERRASGIDLNKHLKLLTSLERETAEQKFKE